MQCFNLLHSYSLFYSSALSVKYCNYLFWPVWQLSGRWFKSLVFILPNSKPAIAQSYFPGGINWKKLLQVNIIAMATSSDRKQLTIQQINQNVWGERLKNKMLWHSWESRLHGHWEEPKFLPASDLKDLWKLKVKA